MEPLNPGPSDSGFYSKDHIGGQGCAIILGQHRHLMDIQAQSVSGEWKFEFDISFSIKPHVLTVNLVSGYARFCL